MVIRRLYSLESPASFHLVGLVYFCVEADPQPVYQSRNGESLKRRLLFFTSNCTYITVKFELQSQGRRLTRIQKDKENMRSYRQMEYTLFTPGEGPYPWTQERIYTKPQK